MSRSCGILRYATCVKVLWEQWFSGTMVQGDDEALTAK
jgi:hypothetical protein